MTYTVDLTAAIAEMRDQLREELLAELRADREATVWPAWMNVTTAARYLDMPVERIRKLVARKAIPFVQEGPGCRLAFDRKAIDTWMRAQGGGA
jgi:excisionase family DNA binding protein